MSRTKSQTSKKRKLTDVDTPVPGPPSRKMKTAKDRINDGATATAAATAAADDDQNVNGAASDAGTIPLSGIAQHKQDTGPIAVAARSKKRKRNLEDGQVRRQEVNEDGEQEPYGADGQRSDAQATAVKKHRRDTEGKGAENEGVLRKKEKPERRAEKRHKQKDANSSAGSEPRAGDDSVRETAAVAAPVTEGKSIRDTKTATPTKGNPPTVPNKAQDDHLSSPNPGKTQPKTKTNNRFILFIGNLPFSTTTPQIQRHFARLGPSGIRHSTDRSTGRSRGFAFLEFDDYDRMKTCLRDYHESLFGVEDGDDDDKKKKQSRQKNGNNKEKSEARRINVELTAGGGGAKSEARRGKIKEKNAKLAEEREREKEKEKEKGVEKAGWKEGEKRDGTRRGGPAAAQGRKKDFTMRQRGRKDGRKSQRTGANAVQVVNGRER